MKVTVFHSLCFAMLWNIFGAVGPLGAQSNALSANAAPLPRVYTPSASSVQPSRFPWKKSIVTTVFWVGEQPTKNNPTPNHKSSWDPQWQVRFGGYDNPDPGKRTAEYRPVGFVPKLNPFYVALPYNDIASTSKHKPEAAALIPWFRERYVRPGKTVLKGQWLAIRYGNRICYAQWEDCGPFNTTDVGYVFGSKRPKNKKNKGAGLDVSPSVRDYLKMTSGARCDWRFVRADEVPAGPWHYYGKNEIWADAQQKKLKEQQARLEQLRKARDAWFRQGGGSGYTLR